MLQKPIALNLKSLEKLKNLINEETEYRSGPKLVNFFNALGFDDTYGQGFPSRSNYTEQKISAINNTERLTECICMLFNPVNFVGRIGQLDSIIADFNQYLDFDGLILVRTNKTIRLETLVWGTIEEEIKFDEEHINSAWLKAIKRKTTDPEGAITIARTLVETTLKHILDAQSIEYSNDEDLSVLYKKIAKSMKLAPEQHQEQVFRQILGSINGVIAGLGELRNKLGDAHGKSSAKVKPRERHSELAVNLAGTISIFLLRTFNER